VHLRPSYPVETSRLRLRPLGEGDLDALVGYHSNPDVHRYLPMEEMDAAAVLDRLTGGTWSRSTLEEEGHILTLGVELAATGELVGDVMLRWVSARDRSGEVGYVLDPRHQRNGYAAEAVDAVLRLAFEVLGLHRVIARIDARNGSSLALSERLGMRREAHLMQNAWVRGAWIDEVDFAMLESEWKDRHS